VYSNCKDTSHLRRWINNTHNGLCCWCFALMIFRRNHFYWRHSNAIIQTVPNSDGQTLHFTNVSHSRFCIENVHSSCGRCGGGGPVESRLLLAETPLGRIRILFNCGRRYLKAEQCGLTSNKLTSLPRLCMHRFAIYRQPTWLTSTRIVDRCKCQRIYRQMTRLHGVG
jgi:hypothetical protein